MDKELLVGIKNILNNYNSTLNNTDTLIIKGLFKIFNDAEFERKHPRKTNGEFAKKFLNSSNYESIEISKSEYGKLTHEINSNISEKQKQKKIFLWYNTEYTYIVENNGFNNYRFIGKYEND